MSQVRLLSPLQDTRTTPNRDEDTVSESAPAAAASRGEVRPTSKARRPGPISRTTTYVRQVVAELRKVIWPTRKELITYTSVVLVFVAVMVSVVALFDFAFTKGVLAVFGK
jgi:preprotein translocase subunit SecE